MSQLRDGNHAVIHSHSVSPHMQEVPMLHFSTWASWWHCGVIATSEEVRVHCATAVSPLYLFLCEWRLETQSLKGSNPWERHWHVKAGMDSKECCVRVTHGYRECTAGLCRRRFRHCSIYRMLGRIRKHSWGSVSLCPQSFPDFYVRKCPRLNTEEQSEDKEMRVRNRIIRGTVDRFEVRDTQYGTDSTVRNGEAPRSSGSWVLWANTLPPELTPNTSFNMVLSVPSAKRITGRLESLIVTMRR